MNLMNYQRQDVICPVGPTVWVDPPSLFDPFLFTTLPSITDRPRLRVSPTSPLAPLFMVARLEPETTLPKDDERINTMFNKRGLNSLFSPNSRPRGRSVMHANTNITTWQTTDKNGRHNAKLARSRCFPYPAGGPAQRPHFQNGPYLLPPPYWRPPPLRHASCPA